MFAHFFHSIIKRAQLVVSLHIDHTYRKIVGVPTLSRSEITPQLILGGQYSRRGFRILESRGITGIVSMRMRARTGLPNLGEVQFLHLPTKDLHAPTLNQLEKGSVFIDTIIRNNGKVYVHCAAGMGRGPTMVAAYLITQGMTLEMAIAHIRSIRNFIHLTKEQMKRLREFEAMHTSSI